MAHCVPMGAGGTAQMTTGKQLVYLYKSVQSRSLT